jgi:hypothetical protein
MKYLLLFLFILPELVFSQQKSIAQNKPNSLATLLMFNWHIAHAVNIENPNDTAYNPAKKIKNWDLSKTSIYRLGNKQLGFTGTGAVEIGVADSVTETRFIARITYANGQKCIYEYDNVVLLKHGGLSYTFRKWNFVNNDSAVRILHYGYKAVCYKDKQPHHQPPLAEIIKKRGNKISYVFTDDDGKPMADKEVMITIPSNGMHYITSVYTNSAGEATSYYKDSDFSSTGHITLLIEYQGLKSSAVVERKNCPIVIKRVLTSKEDESPQISIGPE